jgi:cytochrome c553
MLPEPPQLVSSLDDWSTAELFWIVQNGQKYTGMPAWLAHDREDEIWAVAAFLEQLTGMDEETYDSLAGIGEDEPDGFPFDGEDYRGFDATLADCVACHGADGAGSVAQAVPTIGGQLRSYLERSLRAYHRGERASGFMQAAASRLTDSQIAALAAHFAGDGLRPHPAADADEKAVARGAAIFAGGVPEADVPACSACHENGGDDFAPRLLGQSAAYVEQQLLLFQEGIRGKTGYGAIMAPVARRLSRDQISDVAAFIATADGAGRPEGR